MLCLQVSTTLNPFTSRRLCNVWFKRYCRATLWARRFRVGVGGACWDGMNLKRGGRKVHHDVLHNF